MLDNENESTTSSTEGTESPQPTRRRRAASRPAGAPRPVEVPTEVPVTRPAAESTPQPDAAPAADVQVAPATRRRRASRPTSTPEPVPAAEPETPAAADEPAERPRRTRRSSGSADAESPEVDGETTPRKRATRRAAATPDASAEVADEAAPTKPATRRRRSSRAAAAADPVRDEPTLPEQAIGADETRAGESAAIVTAEDSPSTAEELPAGEETAQEDAIAAALRMAEQNARSRSLVADPFAVGNSRQAQLDALAGAIASGGFTSEGDDESDDEDADLDDTDDEDTEPADEGDQDADDDEDDSDEDSDDDDSSDSDDDRPSRRRRRRGGRRRRRGAGQRSDDADDADDSDNDDKDSAGSDDGADSESDESSDGDASEGDEGSSTRRRRRRRRRSGGSGSGDDSTSSNDEITGIEGSTRMEAKRQRRKENRAAGRRRAPILSEAEFLARRESVDRTMVIRQADDYTQLAVIEDGILVEHYVDRASATSLIGNIYLGRVQNVLPSMEAAFIDIGRGRNAVLYAGEVDWDNFGVSAEDRKVEKVFKSGQSVLVQVTKDPVGAKGARLTGHISLPGRYIVYSPGGHLSGISRKLPDTERARLRDILADLISDDESVIVRTAAEGASTEELVRDVNRLKAQWQVIDKKAKAGRAPEALYAEPDLTLRIVRDLFTEDFARLVVQGNGGPEDSYDAISAYVSHVAPHLAERLERFEASDDGRDVFAKYRIDEQIAKALDRKVFLPSGGSLVIDRTEAMTVVDVNTGRFTGSGGNLEATVTSNNLEAAEEIVRQLRLRDIGGIIVIDFIDMVLPSNRELLLRRLVECLGRDRTRHQVAEVTSLGLVQLTRKKIGTGLAEAFTEKCECCNGSGYISHDEPVDSQAQADGGERRTSHTSRGGSRRRRSSDDNRGKGSDEAKNGKSQQE